MNSLIGWIGGKKLLRKEILARFPADYSRYIEVFGGAGWVLFGRKPDGRMEVFNDRDGDLINLWRCVKYHPEAVRNELEGTLQSREIFQTYFAGQAETDIQRAARYLYLIKESFGSDVRTFATSPRPLEHMLDRLPEVAKRLSRVVIENVDFGQLLSTYDRSDALFYLDPPYHGSEKVYQTAFSEDDHHRLREALGKVRGKWILSYNDDSFIRGLYDGFRIEGVSRQNQLSGKETEVYRELIVRNY